jgi:hypothetical protein
MDFEVLGHGDILLSHRQWRAMKPTEPVWTRLPPRRALWLEVARMALLGTLGGAVLVAGEQWPAWRWVLWGGFGLLFLGGLFRDLRKPVNYRSLEVRGPVIDYTDLLHTHLIDLREVMQLTLVREEALFPDLTGPYIESKWVVQMRDGRRIEVMDEWPHRRVLLKGFRTWLPGFDAQAARTGLRARGEGRWFCFQRP